MTAPTFPPLMQGVAAQGGDDPFERAQAMAALGCDGGTVVHSVQADRLRAALVLAPEVALAEAMAMLPLCAVGFQNALGALAPPEVAVHLGWAGDIHVNGGRCGRLCVAASTRDPQAQPDWLVIGLDLALLPTSDMPGAQPDETALYEEGCADVAATTLLESWARHVMTWIHRWEDEGNAPLHAEWLGLARGVGEEITRADCTGTFLGVDERFGMLIRSGAETRLIPLTDLLEDRS